VVRGALAAGEGEVGLGVAVDTGAFVELRDMAIVANREAGLLVQQPGASVSVARTLIADTQRDDQSSISGAGVRLGFGATLTGEDVAILRNRVSGIFVGGATIGVGGSAKLTRAIVADTMPDEAGTLGRGVDVWQASLEMDASAVLGHWQAGIVVGGDSGTAMVRNTSVQGTTGHADATFGDGIAVVLGAEALLDRCWVTDNARVGLFFAVGTCTAIDVVIAANAIGIHAQDGSQLQEVEAVGEGAGPLQVLVTTSSRFVDNEIRVGSGLLAVPSPVP
jgi:hypothetical protein